MFQPEPMPMVNKLLQSNYSYALILCLRITAADKERFDLVLHSMIQYNPKDWFTFIFKFHREDTFRKLFPLIIGICIYSWLIAWLEIEYWQLSELSRVKNLSLIHSTLAFVISLMLVFRTNTAYERWWEGRRLWGSLVNSSRNLALKLSALVPEEAEFFGVMIPNYAFSLKSHLRGRVELDFLEENASFKKELLKKDEHIPNQISLLIISRITRLQREGKLAKEDLLFLNQELQNFTEICGACERVKKTPIPFSYSVFLKKFIFIYVMTLPFGYVFSLGYLVVPVVALIFYVLTSLELIAEEIEEPFGDDANDLPIKEISEVIRKSVQEILPVNPAEKIQ